jgi:hypothetical protein
MSWCLVGSEMCIRDSSLTDEEIEAMAAYARSLP